MKAYVLVDVDGVVNIFPDGNRVPPGWNMTHVTLASGMKLRIIYDPTLGARLQAFAAKHDAGLMWCTTWEAQANEHISPLIGLPADLPHISLTAPHFRSGVATTKAHSIRLWLDDPATDCLPFVWFDDEYDASVEARHHMGGHPHKVVRCDDRKGLRDRELALAEEFLRLNSR